MKVQNAGDGCQKLHSSRQKSLRNCGNLMKNDEHRMVSWASSMFEAAGGLGVSVLWALGLAVSLVVCCSCSLSVLSPELPQLPEPRPTLRSRTVTQPPSVEDKTEKSEARCYSKQQTCCADLVVPRGQQSLVAVPYLRDSEGVVMLDVVDPIGMPLLKAEVDLSALASRSDQPLLVLRNLRPEARGSLLRSPKRGGSLLLISDLHHEADFVRLNQT